MAETASLRPRRATTLSLTLGALLGPVAPVKLIPLSTFGLMTTAEVAARHGRSVSAVEKWIGEGHLMAVPVGARCYLVTRADCEGFATERPGPRGRLADPRKRGGARTPLARGAGRVVRLARFGLVTVRQFAGYHGCVERTVLRWIAEDCFPVVPVRTRSLTCYLVRRSDCEAFKKPKMGRPPGSKDRRKRKPARR